MLGSYDCHLPSHGAAWLQVAPLCAHRAIAACVGGKAVQVLQADQPRALACVLQCVKQAVRQGYWLRQLAL